RLVVAERDTFVKSRGARGVLDVDRFVGRDVVDDLLQTHSVLRRLVVEQLLALSDEVGEGLTFSDLGLSVQVRGHGVEEDEVEGGNLRGYLGGDRVEVRVRG